jgi:hypothetical protein
VSVWKYIPVATFAQTSGTGRCLASARTAAVSRDRGVPQLVSGDIEADGAVARLTQETASPAGAAGHIDAYRSPANA